MRILDRVLAQDGVSTKYLQQTCDGFVVEATYVKRPAKHMVCISTQVGCVIGCTFCASGLRSEDTGSRFRRSLKSAEIVEESCNVVREIDFGAHQKPLTFAFMGEGEPFLNFVACVRACYALTAMPWPVSIQFSVSTSGIRPDLIRHLGEMAFPFRLKLQVSLHGPNDEIRSLIVPVSKPLSEIVAATRAYRERSGRPVIWNYVMCDGVNDRLEHAEQLVRLLGPGWRVKFTRLNPTAGSLLRPASQARVDQFREVLENGGLSTNCSQTDESGIGSGCGQLSYHFIRRGGNKVIDGCLQIDGFTG